MDDSDYGGQQGGPPGPAGPLAGLSGSPTPGSFGTTGRGPRLLTGSGRRATAISTASTLVVIGALVAVFLLAPGSAEVRHTFFSPHDMWQSFIGNPKAGYYSVGAAIWLNIRMFLAAEVLILAFSLVIALIRQSTGPVPAAGARRDLRGLLPRRPAAAGDPGHRLRGARAQPPGRLPPAAAGLRGRGTGPVLLRLRLRGVPGRAELGPPQPGGGRALARAVTAGGAAVRDPAAGGAQHHSPAAERLHQPAEGHRAGRRARRDRGEQRRPDLRQHRLQLLQLHRGGHPVPPPHHPARPVH